MKAALRGIFCAVIFLAALRLEASPRVALMDFSTDDNSYRSAQTAADFSSLLQVQLADEPGVEWVERAQLDKSRQELELSAMEGMNGGAALRRGKWVKADWMITGQFSLDDQNRRVLFLEITDLQHADVLASKTITFSGAATPQFQTATNQVSVAASALRQLLTEAHLRQQQTADKISVAVLFFADVSDSGGFPSGIGALGQDFDEALDRGAATNNRVRLVRFPKAYRSLEESEMILDGLVEADRNAWQQTADLYVWGTYYSLKQPGDLQEKKLEMELHLWDGVSQPIIIDEEVLAESQSDLVPKTWSASMTKSQGSTKVEISGELPKGGSFGSFNAGQVQMALNRLVGQAMAHAQKKAAPADTTPIRKDIAKSMVETYDRMTMSFHHREELGLNDPEKFSQAVHMLETACFFDPDNADARVLYITCRWGWWMDFTFKVKNEFMSKWRRSEAWGKYVNRFGLKPVTVELPFPYQQQGGIPTVYVRSLEDVSRMFPQWHSMDEMALEDKWQQQGVHTDLIEAEGHGFPKEMPHDLAMKWKTEVEAELVRRKEKVAEYAQINAVATPTTPATVAPPVMKNPATPVVQMPRMVPPASQTSSQMVPTPSWVRDSHAIYSMFRLSPPNVLPLEIQPDMHEIKFPKQFEVQTIDHLDFLDDQLLILAMDERSAPSSDNLPDVSAEILDKHKRLWLLKLGEENPTLYEAGLFPQSVNTFLLKNDQLWVAGKTTGYLDLKTHDFRKFGLADGFDLQASDALDFAGGHFFAAGENFKVSSFDATQNRWSSLSLPPAHLSGGTDSPFLLAGNQQWLCYVAGSVLIRDFTHNTWTNLANLNSVQHVLADDSGFWFGGRDGLHFYDPAGKSLKHGTAPSTFEGSFISTKGGGYFTGNAEMSRGSLERMDGQIQGLMKKLQSDRKKIHATKGTGGAVADPLHLDWRVPGEVTALADDGDFLWVGVGNYFGNYLLLLHKPSNSMVACCVMQVRDKISSLAISKKSVWIGTAYGDHKLLQLRKDAFTSIPQSRWASLEISPEERAGLVRGMSVRDQAMYAFYAGDDARVAGLLGEENPDKASIEEMFLLAFSYDTLGLDRPERARFWFGQIISRFPDSPWAKTAQIALAENEQNHKVKAHEASLLAEYDLNHDGVLDAREKIAMEKDSTYQAEEKKFNAVELDNQLKEIMRKFDLNGDGKLDRDELEHLKAQVSAFSEAPPQMLAGHKILVAPLMSKNFPSVPAILHKYDTNQEEGLNVGELEVFAQDMQKTQ